MSFDVVDSGHRDKCVREWCCSDRAVNKTSRNFTLPRECSFKASTTVVLLQKIYEDTVQNGC